MSQVLLYPKKGGTGGANPADPWAFPEKIAEKLLKSGAWSNVPDVSNEKVAVSLIEKAQQETKAEKEKIAKELAELKALKAEIEAMKAQLSGDEQVKKPGRPAKTAEV